jgi:hypothetical protein
MVLSRDVQGCDGLRAMTYNPEAPPEFVEKMREIAKALDETFNGDARGDEKKIGFALMLFPYNSTDGKCNFISNGANRQDLVVLMKEMILRFESHPFQLGGRA